MFVSEALKTHLETSATVTLESLVLAEWNMNMPDNIFKLGNYRYRPQGTNTKYLTIQSTFDQNDVGEFYTGATDADIVVDGGFDNEDNPIRYTAIKQTSICNSRSRGKKTYTRSNKEKKTRIS